MMLHHGLENVTDIRESHSHHECLLRHAPSSHQDCKTTKDVTHKQKKKEVVMLPWHFMSLLTEEKRGLCQGHVMGQGKWGQSALCTRGGDDGWRLWQFPMVALQIKRTKVHQHFQVISNSPSPLWLKTAGLLNGSKGFSLTYSCFVPCTFSENEWTNEAKVSSGQNT